MHIPITRDTHKIFKMIAMILLLRLILSCILFISIPRFVFNIIITCKLTIIKRYLMLNVKYLIFILSILLFKTILVAIYLYKK